MEPMAILLASERRELFEMLRRVCESLGGDTTCTLARSVAEARSVLEEIEVELLIVDLAIEDGTGVDLVRAARSAARGTSVLVVTDMHVRDYDRAAMKLGVAGFVVHPVRLEHLHFEIAHIKEVRDLRRAQERMDTSGFAGIVGASRQMREVFDLVRTAASTDAPVAIQGESGTGKELVSRAIHTTSSRRDGPYICLNPSSIPVNLLESELFGHKKGSFTGAFRDHVGYIESAQEGTLFLDEIGDLPPPIQTKLLRVLQEKVICPVGSSKPVRVDFRLITATHRDLLEESRKDRFREDLYYRIHVFPIRVPPLRERRFDIPLLTDHFLRKYAVDLGREIVGISDAALEAFVAYPWPGNVRELENAIHRLAAIKPHGSVIDLGDLTGLFERQHPSAVESSQDLGGSVAPFRSEIRPLRDVTVDYVRWVYETLGRNKARTARLLEIDRATLYRKLREADHLLS